MVRKLPEQKTGLNGLQYLDVLQVITNCEGCGADIELRTRLAKHERDMFIPLSNDEMQQVMLLWLKSLPEKEQGERVIAIVLEMAEEDEKREAGDTSQS